MRRSTLLVILLVALLAAPVICEAEKPKGNLIIIGGGGEPEEVWPRLIELAGGKQASIIILPTATESKTSGPAYEKYLEEEYGCTNVEVLDLKTRLDAFTLRNVRLLRNAGGIFFTGGDQTLILIALYKTPAGKAIKQAFTRGAVIAGTSAGAAIMGEKTITGIGDFEVIKSATVQLWPGFEFVSGAVFDQHFIARKRLNRLLSVILENPEYLGIGIDESTAVWVRPEGRFDVLGGGSAVVIDASGSTVNGTNQSSDPANLGVYDLKVHILLPGDTFDMNTKTVTDRTK
ncbi:MAG TPA: cyanophycinase [Acidobacteriota bacterium]|nr:cyanophycinase [Acidobacteriota bacterium]